jgi:hypothetical protein
MIARVTIDLAPDEKPGPDRRAREAEGLPPQPAPLPAAMRAVDAARGFSAGNRYLTGNIIDRSA